MCASERVRQLAAPDAMALTLVAACGADAVDSVSAAIPTGMRHQTRRFVFIERCAKERGDHAT